LHDGLEQGLNPQAIAILKLLIFTGARKGEIETLRWNEVDFDSGYLRLADSKTGQKAIPLNAGALEILANIPRLEGSPFVFPAHRSDGHYEGTPKVWRIIRNYGRLSKMSVCMTFDTASRALRFQAARACRSSERCLATQTARRRNAMRTCMMIRSGQPSEALRSENLI
jgi:hypothetical protein